MADITERLREFGPDWTKKHNDGKRIPYELCLDAAKEIERLNALNGDLANSLGAENLRIRSVLQQIIAQCGRFDITAQTKLMMIQQWAGEALNQQVAPDSEK